MHPAVSLASFLPGHLPALRQWLQRPHVARWYPSPDDHLEWAAATPPGGCHAVIVVRGAAVGYLRWQAVTRDVLDSVGLHEIPAGAVDADILLGEESAVGHGYGPQALHLLVAALEANATVPLVGLTTSVQNRRARRSFAKAGFVFVRRYEPPGFGPCDLLIRRLPMGGT